LVAIDNILVSDPVLEEQFVCDLQACKGACCEDGDAGAPLEKDELQILNQIYEKVKPFLTKEGIEAISQQGKYQYDQEFGWVTPTIEGKMCAYGHRDARGVITCGIEQSFQAGVQSWRKPISCHLFPIRTKKSRKKDMEFVNYEPRESLCDPACAFGKKLKVPVFVFLKDALVRKYGEDFFKTLEAAAKHALKNP
jgi:hypothetical protein